MKHCRTYKVDGIIFKSLEEIDEFEKNQYIDAYKNAVKLFVNNSTMENSIYCDECAERLMKFYDFKYDQIEQMEIEVMESM